jgi:hypothetical protein
MWTEGKWCNRCKTTKPPEEFNKNRTTKTGLSNWCKLCCSEQQKEYRKTNRYKKKPEKHRQTEAYKLKRKLYCRDNRLRMKANSQVLRAIRRGDLKRPQYCSKCKKHCRPHGHHDNYNKPLKVVWLCRSCHVSLHVDIAKREGTKLIKLPLQFYKEDISSNGRIVARCNTIESAALFVQCVNSHDALVAFIKKQNPPHQHDHDYFHDDCTLCGIEKIRYEPVRKLLKDANAE